MSSSLVLIDKYRTLLLRLGVVFLASGIVLFAFSKFSSPSAEPEQKSFVGEKSTPASTAPSQAKSGNSEQGMAATAGSGARPAHSNLIARETTTPANPSVAPMNVPVANTWEYYQQLGDNQLNGGKYWDAMASYQKGIDLAQNSSSIGSSQDKHVAQMLRSQASANLKVSRRKEAFDLLTESASLDPTPAVLMDICKFQTDSGDVVGALAACDKASVADPKNAEGYFLKAKSLIAAKGGLDSDGAHFKVPFGANAALRKYIELAPNGPHAREAREMMMYEERPANEKRLRLVVISEQNTAVGARPDLACWAGAPDIPVPRIIGVLPTGLNFSLKEDTTLIEGQIVLSNGQTFQLQGDSRMVHSEDIKVPKGTTYLNGEMKWRVSNGAVCRVALKIIPDPS